MKFQFIIHEHSYYVFTVKFFCEWVSFPEDKKRHCMSAPVWLLKAQACNNPNLVLGGIKGTTPMICGKWFSRFVSITQLKLSVNMNSGEKGTIRTIECTKAIVFQDNDN